MATPERELPPLRVRITGDNSSFRKSISEVESLARKMASYIQRTVKMSSAGAGGGLAGFGNRADIYMHAAAIRNLVSSLKGVISASAAWQDMSIQMEVFTGSAAKAADTMKQIQSLALISPYSMATLGDAARTMMSYGVETDKAMGITRSLADVAGGSATRMHRLAYALGQISSVGHLTGMELRQLTEVGFNPLMTIAKEMAKDKSPEGIAKQYAILDGMKKKHMITTDMVVAALKQETQQGGRFAGMMNKMAQTMSGLAQQSEEYAQLIGRHFMDTLREDIENALRGLLSYLKAAEEWVRTHKDAARQIAVVASQVIAAIAAFHAMGFVLALVRWNMRSLLIVFSAFRALILTLIPVQLAWWAITSLCTVGMSLLNLAMTGPLGLAAALALAFMGVWAAADLVRISVYAASDAFKGMKVDVAGMLGTLRSWADNAEGFLSNFGHNTKILADYVKDNWKSLGKYMMDVMNGMLKALPGNIESAMKLAMAFIGDYSNAMGRIMQMRALWAPKDAYLATFGTADDMAQWEKQKQLLVDATMWEAGENSKMNQSKRIKEAMAGMRSGMEGITFEGPSIDGLKFDKVPWNFPKSDDVPIPPKDAVDYAAMLGKGTGGKAAGVSTAVRAGTSSHAEQIYNTTRAMQARTAGATGPKDPQLEANRLLKAIEKNTRDTPPETTLEAANLYGMTL